MVRFRVKSFYRNAGRVDDDRRSDAIQKYITAQCQYAQLNWALKA
jgi:hypothetical protein